MTDEKGKKAGGNSDEGQALAKREYTERERELIAAYRKKSVARPLKFKKVKGDSNPVFKYQEADEMLAAAKSTEALGTADRDLQHFLLEQVVMTFSGCISSEGSNQDEIPKFLNNAMAVLQGIAPRDEIEGMLAIQMIGVHNMAMVATKRAMIVDQTFEGRQAAFKQADKMLRMYAQQIEALKKYRTGGQQKVTVEYVHVNEGGQAIVGNVTGVGGSKDEKSK